MLCLYIRSNGEQVFCFSGKRKGKGKKERGLSSLLFLLAADLTELDNEGFLLTFCCFLGPSYVSIFICIFYLDIFVLGLGFLYIYILFTVQFQKKGKKPAAITRHDTCPKPIKEMIHRRSLYLMRL